MFLSLKKDKLKTNMFGQEGDCNKAFFYEPMFYKMWKVIVFWAPFGEILVDVQKAL